MSATVNNEDLELEEGEIAEDSNDGCSLTNDDNDVGQIDNFDGLHDTGGGGADAGGGSEPQKKRKKVVRKVRRKIKVKKKVLRKKGGSANNNGSSSTPSSSSLLMQQQQQQLLPPTSQPQPQHQHQQQRLQQPQQQQLLQQNHGSNPQLALLNQQPVISMQNQQPVPTCNANLVTNQTHQQSTNQLDSLWEQQILMLQELQKQQTDQQAQILRAAATDEDLRIFATNMANIVCSNTNMNTSCGSGAGGVVGVHYGSVVSQHPQTVPSMSAPTTTTTSTALTAISNNQSTYHQQHHHQQPSQTMMHNQTPSSPDDENGKSSYEAISKMLTLLRNSANVSDSSENNESDQMNQSNNTSTNVADADLPDLNKLKPKSSIEYSLVPILVEGIDYTKYKLLSQYEPKFKNDPRLNQQT